MELPRGGLQWGGVSLCSLGRKASEAEFMQYRLPVGRGGLHSVHPKGEVVGLGDGVLFDQMEQFSAKVGIPVNCILPVKNYHEEGGLQDDMDELLLKALRQIVNYANDYVKSLP
ncbi:hypothetical protein AAFF_G00430960 [Aldrovandia affinis]|uniref:Uncharacterized protein n=1 Tax=Aldrovandia affinis TaxID=143900 RepID=A0AAD7R302_9TELE|nr:hypothetical protein AAFF_G00430960 [Aldrovandia affinis]